jgi:CubicO group peptidase (beta-lactamase class C family)
VVEGGAQVLRPRRPAAWQNRAGSITYKGDAVRSRKPIGYGVRGTRWAFKAATATLSLVALCASAQWRPSSAEQQALDAAAFQGVSETIGERFTDVQSVVVSQGGRLVYQYWRDGNPDALRDVHSVMKSALSTLIGIALAQDRIASLDQPVVALMPEWAGLNPDPRAQAITVRHLLTMSAGFAVDDPAGIKPAGRPREAWARPLAHAPGQAFAYDNALIPVLATVLEKAVGMSVADYTREQLVVPLGLHEPSYQRGVGLRTEDMARLGQLFLQNGVWEGRQIVPASYVAQATQAQNAGGLPVSLPYGYMWWVVPSKAARPTFMAAGYGGQFIWVNPSTELVVAVTSNVSPDPARHGQSMQLIRGALFAAAQKRAAGN